jgi:hypothetical protein
MGCGASWLFGERVTNRERLTRRKEEIVLARLDLEGAILEQTQRQRETEEACFRAVYRDNRLELAMVRAKQVVLQEESIVTMSMVAAELGNLEGQIGQVAHQQQMEGHLYRLVATLVHINQEMPPGVFNAVITRLGLERGRLQSKAQAMERGMNRMAQAPVQSAQPNGQSAPPRIASNANAAAEAVLARLGNRARIEPLEDTLSHGRVQEVDSDSDSSSADETDLLDRLYRITGRGEQRH